MGRIVRVFAIIVAALLLIALALPFLIDPNEFRPMLVSQLTHALGREVKLGDLKLSILSGGVSANDLSIADDPSFSRAPFLHAKSLKLGVELWPLIFSRKLNVTSLVIDQPEIALLQTAAGEWNFSSFGTKHPTNPTPAPASGKTGLDLPISLIKINDGRLSLAKVNSRAKPQTLEKVSAELQDFSATSVFPFSLSAKVGGGGDIKLKGKAGPINQTDAAMTPVAASLNVTRLNLVASGFIEPSSGIAGLASIDGSGSSNGQKLEVNGRLKGEELKLAKNGTPAKRPLEFNFVLEQDLRTHAGVVKRGDIQIGKATANLSGTYNLRGDSVLLNMKLSGSNMPVPELAQLLPALGIVLPAGSSLQAGTAHANLIMEGPVDRLTTAGTVGLDNARLAGFDLGSKLAALERLAGIRGGPNTEIQTLGASVRVNPEGTTADDIKLVAPTIGELSGGGIISANHSLDFKMRATLHTSGALMAALGQKGDTSVPFLIQGTSENPSFRPDMRGIASEKLKGVTGNSDIGKAAGSLLDSLLNGKKKEK